MESEPQPQASEKPSGSQSWQRDFTQPPSSTLDNWTDCTGARPAFTTALLKECPDVESAAETASVKPLDWAMDWTKICNPISPKKTWNQEWDHPGCGQHLNPDVTKELLKARRVSGNQGMLGKSRLNPTLKPVHIHVLHPQSSSLPFTFIPMYSISNVTLAGRLGAAWFLSYIIFFIFFSFFRILFSIFLSQRK